MRPEYSNPGKIKQGIMKLKSIVVAILCISCCSILQAQSQAEIEMVKKMAKQKGYTDAQIEQMVNGYTEKGAVTETASSTTSAIDRNVVEPVLILPDEGRSDGEDSETAIFGHSIFRSTVPYFLPSYNIPTPENYRLSAGDEVVIDIWGAVVTNITKTISPEGTIFIPNLGPVPFTGQTVAQAEKSVREHLSKIYSGIEGDKPDTFVKLSLGRMRSVTVNVIGEVSVPGFYTMPALTTVSSAIYMAGGITPIATVRDIKIYRNGKEAATFDLYKYMVSGSSDGDIRLEDNDIIMVSSYRKIVSAGGEVKRRMKYELTDGETVEDLIKYSGGFTGNSYPDEVYVERVKYEEGVTGAVSRSFTVSKENFSTFILEDGDSLSVRANKERFSNRVNISGAVWRPGDYTLQEGMTSLDELIKLAGGVQDGAYLGRGFILRYGEKREREQVSFSLQNVILGGEKVELHPDDSVRIYFRENLLQKRLIYVEGEVNSPGEFEYRDGVTLGDAILMANGITDAATLERVKIIRRIHKKDENLDLKDTVALIMHYDLLKKSSDAGTLLMPFDIVQVYRSKNYRVQENIKITGEVNYPGVYAAEKRTVRLSDIVRMAYGFNEDAYPQGASLTRKLTEKEIQQLIVAKNIVGNQLKDSSAVSLLDEVLVEDSYKIAINLDLAVKNPGGEYDVVVRGGDIIDVPKYNNTVRVSGAVMSPNVVTFRRGANYKYYISNSGGYLKDAIKKSAYMVHANGYVAKRGSSLFKVEPGTQIVVPQKNQEDKLIRAQKVATIMGIATSTASMAAMITSIINTTK